MEILATEKLTKKYKRLTALNQLDFTIQKGMVFGLLGPNGSGKTTTLGMLLNVIQPTSGIYRWFGKSPTPDSRRQIGAILEIPCFLPYLTAVQNLKIIAEIKQCSYQAIDKTLQTVGLYERRNDPFKTYSLGMKQRLAIGAALLSDPEVLIFDEPTNGLDPKGIVEIRELIIDIAQTGKTIILASHLLDEVQKVCSDFMVLRKGEKLFQGRVEDALLNQKTIEVGSPDLAILKNALERFSGIQELTMTASQCILKTDSQVTTTQIGQFLLAQNIPVNHLVKKEGSLEKEFLNILSEHE